MSNKYKEEQHKKLLADMTERRLAKIECMSKAEISSPAIVDFNNDDSDLKVELAAAEETILYLLNEIERLKRPIDDLLQRAGGWPSDVPF